MPRESEPTGDIGAAIRKIRGDLSQEQFAQQLGVAARTVARWESGTSAPRANVLKSLGIGGAAAGGAAVGSLLGLPGIVVGAAIGAAHAYKSSLRHERQVAALKAVLNAIAAEHKLPIKALQGACRSVVGEMLDQGVASEELLALLEELG